MPYYNYFLGRDKWKDNDHILMDALNRYDALAVGVGNFAQARYLENPTPLDGYNLYNHYTVKTTWVAKLTSSPNKTI